MKKQFKRFFFRNILPEDSMATGSFVDIINYFDDFFLLSKFGKVYKIHNIDEKLVNDSLLNGSQAVNETLLNNTVIERLVNVKRLESTCLLVAEIDGETAIIFCSGNFLYFHCGEASQSKIELPAPFKALFDLDNYIIGLDFSGGMTIICPFTKFIQAMPASRLPIDDFIVLDSNTAEIELLCFTKVDEDGDRQLEVLEFPSFKAKNQMILQGETWLVKQPKGSVNIYYISGSRNEESNNFDQIEMKIVSEHEPSQRLRKLIQRGHLKEAEEFAVQFELSLQPVYEARARLVCNQIKFEGGRVDLSEKFKELLELLQIIESKLFLVSICDFEFPDRKMTETFLKFLLKNLGSSEYLPHVKQINEKILRIDTLRLIDPNEKNSQWRDFVHHRDLKVSQNIVIYKANSSFFLKFKLRCFN